MPLVILYPLNHKIRVQVQKQGKDVRKGKYTKEKQTQKNPTHPTPKLQII